MILQIERALIYLVNFVDLSRAHVLELMMLSMRVVYSHAPKT
jgi:hypothetical protein